MKTRINWLVAAAVGAGLLSAAAPADVITHGSTTITMDLVAIGNAGNTADTFGVPSPCGAVAYAYRIGKYEVSAAQWAAVIAADPSVGNAGSWSGSQPTASTSWHEAAKFCNWLTTGSATSGYYTISGGLATPNALSHQAYWAANGTTFFIPTEDEWYKAAYYDPNQGDPGLGGYWNYPTGSSGSPAGVAGGTAPGTAVFGELSTPADANNSGGLSPYGTMGQGANVWEWNETLSGGNGVIRGASYGDNAFVASIYMKRDQGPGFGATSEQSNVGFRVAAIGVVPEPASLALLALGAVALCRRGRRQVG